jgi:hypothetical protein
MPEMPSSPAPAAPAPASASAAPATPVAPGNWYDKFAVDAFVDAYGAINWNWPKPQAPVNAIPSIGGNGYRALDVAEGFALNWFGVNASYTSDNIGGTIGLRVGPGAGIYNSSSPNPTDTQIGLQYVKQAYAEWKPASPLTLDFGKWDQPYGSEVADSQLNMNYTRTVLWWYMQPLFFTGLRVDYAPVDALDVQVFVANGWNNTFDNNRGKTIGAQVMLKPMDSLMLYLGWVGGPEQSDTTTGTAMGGATTIADVPDANSHWRNMFDFVADFSPTSALRFLLNADYKTESTLPDATGTGTHTESVYGGNLVIRYNVTDAFYASLRASSTTTSTATPSARDSPRTSKMEP